MNGDLLGFLLIVAVFAGGGLLWMRTHAERKG
jgi:hypothetical protein